MCYLLLGYGKVSCSVVYFVAIHQQVIRTGLADGLIPDASYAIKKVIECEPGPSNEAGEGCRIRLRYIVSARLFFALWEQPKIFTVMMIYVNVYFPVAVGFCSFEGLAGLT